MLNAVMRLRGARFLVLLVAALAVVPAWSVDLAKELNFEIAPQPLNSALLEFARQANVQVMSSTEAVGTHASPGVNGRHSVADALDELLKGTGLHYQAAGDGTIMVKPQEKTAQSGEMLHLAQADSPAANAEPPKAADGDELELEEVVVTGTHIRGVTPSSSPLYVYDRAAIERSGAGSVEQFVRKIPQNFALLDGDTIVNNGQNTQVGSNTARGATVDLYGLGIGTTLVLLNGHRLSPGGSGGSFVDISMIPLSAIERVEVLPDGASALYGADAVGGVVNFILRKDFDGGETSLRYGDTTRGGGATERSFAQTLGRSWQDGNALVVYEHYSQDPLLGSKRDFVPDQGGELQFVPDQKRDSALASVRQRFASNVEAFAEAFYSKREFTQDYTSFLTFVHDEGEAQQYGAAAGLSHDLPADWRGKLTANYSRTQEQSDSFLGSTVFPLHTDSRLWSGEYQADGALFAAPGGQARASVGAAARREEFDPPGSALRRNVTSLYGELFVPLIGTPNSKSWAQRLELSLAARFDDYERMGSSTDPKIGLLWAPTDGFKIRGTYATSFRVPALSELSPDQDYSVFELPDSLVGGTSIVLSPNRPANPRLQPEQAQSLTLGFDLKPARVAGLTFSTTYFHIDFDDRIARPPTTGFDLLAEPALAPFIDRAPDPAELARIFSEDPVFDFVGGVQSTDVDLVLDLRLQNIATTRASGLDTTLEYGFAAAAADWRVFLNGTYLFELEFKTADAVPGIDIVDTVYNPVDLRLRGGLSWSRGGLYSTLTVNHSGSYRNDRVSPAGRVDAWTTADWQIGYRTADASAPTLLSGLALTLDVQNLTDEDPPHVASDNPFQNFGFDSTNASPRGRFVSLTLGKRW